MSDEVYFSIKFEWMNSGKKKKKTEVRVQFSGFNKMVLIMHSPFFMKKKEKSILWISEQKQNT